MSTTKPNRYNWGGIAPQSAERTPASAPSRLGRYTDFSGNAQKEDEEDEGHSGNRNLIQGVDILAAYSEPEYGDKIRPDEVIGDFLRGFFGTVTSTQQESTVAYTHAFEEDEDLPFYSFFQGYNVDSEEAKRFADLLVSKLEFNFNAKETPTWTGTLTGNFPDFDITEPSLTYPDRIVLFAPQLTVYLDETSGTIGTTEMPGFKEGSVSMDNGIETEPLPGGDFGETQKDMGALNVEGSFIQKHIDTDIQRRWATGASDGADPIAVNEEYQLRFELTGAFIKDGSGADTTYPYLFRLDVHNIVISNVDPTEDGDDARSYESTWKAIPNSSNITVSAYLQNKVTSYASA